MGKAWDWETPSKRVADLDDWKSDFVEVQELVAGRDGERIAAIVKTEEDSFVPCVNGEAWTNTFEKAWSLQFGPDDRLVCIGMNDDEWTVIVEDEPWEEAFDYVWNLRFSPDGRSIAANIRNIGRIRGNPQRRAVGKQIHRGEELRNQSKR